MVCVCHCEHIGVHDPPSFVCLIHFLFLLGSGIDVILLIDILFHSVIYLGNVSPKNYYLSFYAFQSYVYVCVYTYIYMKCIVTNKYASCVLEYINTNSKKICV